MSAPVMALIPDLGLVTATLSDATVGGFGFDFGLSFGGPAGVGPVTATLTGNGVGTAALAQPVGFGEGGFGDTPFGGYATAVLPATAVLAGNGVGTALATEVLVSAELQLV